MVAHKRYLSQKQVTIIDQTPSHIGISDEMLAEAGININPKTVRHLLLLPQGTLSTTIASVLGRWAFTDFGPKFLYIEIRTLTIRMQELMECSLTDIGISVRNAEALQSDRNVSTLGHLLQLSTEDYGHHPFDNIANFGPKAKREVYRCLEEAGFELGPYIEWEPEQDTIEYIKAHSGGKPP